MKKIITTILVLTICLSSLFASVTTEGDIPNYTGITDAPFTFQDKRTYRLGGTGIALAEGMPAVFLNPANLAGHKRFTLNLPQLNVSIYGITNMMRDETIKQYINQAISQKSFGPISDNLVEILVAILGNTFYNYTYSPLLNIQADVGFTAGGFALDVFAQLNTNIYNLSGGSGNIELVPSAAIGASLGFGFIKDVSKKTKLSFGVSASVIERAVSDGARISDFNSASGGDMSNVIDTFKSKRVAVGLFVPVNVGVTIGLLENTLRISAAYRNMDFAGRKMYNYCSIEELIQKPFIAFNGDKSSALGNLTISDYSSLDIGVGINPKWGLFNPRIEADLVDLLNWKKDDVSDNSKIWAHLKLGAEISLLGFARVGAGLNQGRLCFGARFDLFPVVIDVDYGWVESTPKLGEMIVDYISVQVKLGWDRTK